MDGEGDGEFEQEGAVGLEEAAVVLLILVLQLHRDIDPDCQIQLWVQKLTMNKLEY